MKITICIEIDEGVKRVGKLVSKIGPLVIKGQPENKMATPNQTASFTNVAAPQSASFLLGPVELFSADGTTDEGIDAAIVTFVSSDTTIATVGPAPVSAGANTTQINLVPGASGSVNITFTDTNNNSGGLALAIAPPVAVPGVLVATVGPLQVTG